MSMKLELLLIAVAAVAIGAAVQLESPLAYTALENCATHCPCDLDELCPEPSQGGDYCHKCDPSASPPLLRCNYDWCQWWNGDEWVQTKCNTSFCCNILICWSKGPQR